MTPTSNTTNIQTMPISLCPKRTICLPVWDNDPCYSVISYNQTCPTEQANIILMDKTNDPQTYKEAMVHSDATKWDIAYEDKIRNFQQMGVYNIVLWPKGYKVVRSKWVLCTKCGPDSQVQKYKA